MRPRPTIAVRAGLTAAVTVAVTAVLGLSVSAAAQADAASPYQVGGYAHLNATDSRVAVHRTTLRAHFAPDGSLSGTLPVPPSRAHFTAGTSPAVATVSFEEVGRLTGSQFPTRSGSALTATGRYVMRLSDFSLDGHPIDLGPDCRTITPVTMSASTPAGGSWDQANGGRITGTFTIGGFETCNGLERAIDNTISGSGNEIVLRLRPPSA